MLPPIEPNMKQKQKLQPVLNQVHWIEPFNWVTTSIGVSSYGIKERLQSRVTCVPIDSTLA